MLRSGYSNPSVTRELEQSHFVGALDANSEQMLLKAGASQDLIDAIRNGTYALSAAQDAAAVKRINELAQQRKIQAEKTKQQQQRYDAEVEKDRAKATNQQSVNSATVDYLRDSLVRYRDGALVPIDNEIVARKKVILYYFSAHWCGPCRKFTPQLIDYYNRTVEAHPEFEVVFYSMDRSATEMEHYMQETGMPWPAIDYAKREQKQELVSAAGNSIPALVLVERTGRLLSKTMVDGKYLGPEHVLADLDSYLSGKDPQVAQVH
jgi:nucleoredoxin